MIGDTDGGGLVVAVVGGSRGVVRPQQESYQRDRSSGVRAASPRGQLPYGNVR